MVKIHDTTDIVVKKMSNQFRQKSYHVKLSQLIPLATFRPGPQACHSEDDKPTQAPNKSPKKSPKKEPKSKNDSSYSLPKDSMEESFKDHSKDSSSDSDFERPRKPSKLKLKVPKLKRKPPLEDHEGKGAPVSSHNNYKLAPGGRPRRSAAMKAHHAWVNKLKTSYYLHAWVYDDNVDQDPYYYTVTTLPTPDPHDVPTQPCSPAPMSTDTSIPTQPNSPTHTIPPSLSPVVSVPTVPSSPINTSLVDDENTFATPVASPTPPTPTPPIPIRPGSNLRLDSVNNPRLLETALLNVDLPPDVPPRLSSRLSAKTKHDYKTLHSRGRPQ